ncbi:MAG: restriction endonuclease subunit S [Haliea sp.]|nr:restriction endonuclease subunit S [Haliea sp.]
MPYIRVTDFNEFSVDERGLLFLTKEAQRQISRYIINRNDVYISIAGSIGITGMIPPNLEGANLTENAARLIANDSSQLYPRFLMYWLASHDCQAEIKAQTVKNAQPKLALARIKSSRFRFPRLTNR